LPIAITVTKTGVVQINGVVLAIVALEKIEVSISIEVY